MNKFYVCFKDGEFYGGEYEKFRQDENWYIFTAKKSQTLIAKSEVKYIEVGVPLESKSDLDFDSTDRP